MKEFKGTKGEWSSSYDNDSGNEGDCFHEFHSIGSSHGYIGQIEREEDANLIITAPKLLDALMDIVSRLEMENPLPHEESISAAKSLIAKALGEKP